MDNFILIDLETRDFNVESGIYEVAAVVVENWEIKDKFYIGIVEDESLINHGYGIGYKDVSEDNDCKDKFKKFISKYNYPLVAHNGSFDRRFLLYYKWINEDYPFYDSIRAIKYSNSKLFSYSLAHLKDFLDLKQPQTHTAMGDVELTLEILKYFKPDIWIPIGTTVKNHKNKSYNPNKPHGYDAINKNFEIITDLFLGKNIVFTGKGPYTRNQLMELAKKCGADITSNSITKKTNLLVVGDKPGSKFEKARKLGIEIMDMEDFYHMVDGIVLTSEQKSKVVQYTNKKTNNKNEVFEILSNKLSGECVTPYPMSVAMSSKVAYVVKRHGGTVCPGLREKETTLLVYQPYAEELITVKKARNLNIKTMTLGEFNRYLLDVLEK